MFLYSTAKTKSSIQNSIGAANSVIAYIENDIGAHSNDAVNRLMSVNRGNLSTPRVYSLVSKNVAFLLATAKGPNYIRALAKLCPRESNPALFGILFEMWFFACLQQGEGVTVIDEFQKKTTWDRCDVDIFDYNDFAVAFVAWLKSAVWNQGGFDTIYINGDTGTVRFVQITAADSHSFKIRHFRKFLDKLTKVYREFKVQNVEIYFVVEQSKFETFQISPVEDEGLLQEYGWEEGEELDKVQIVTMNDWTQK
jgi:hypothetical protein